MTDPKSTITNNSTTTTNNKLVYCKELHAEVLDLETGYVWQTHGPIGREAYDALELPAKHIKVGIGSGVMDEHYFRRSPGATSDGPLSEREIDGHRFIHCANPPKGGPETPLGANPKFLLVDKYHSLIFEAGNTVLVIEDTDGRDFVQLISASREGGSPLQPKDPASGSADLDLPDGWKLRNERFETRTTIHLPHPTRAWFFANGASFQGPIDTFGKLVPEEADLP